MPLDNATVQKLRCEIVRRHAISMTNDGEAGYLLFGSRDVEGHHARHLIGGFNDRQRTFQPIPQGDFCAIDNRRLQS